jgi:hypothetical protein
MPDQSAQKNAEVSPENSLHFDFRLEIADFITKDGYTFSGYYDGQIQAGTPPEAVTAQVSTMVEYEMIVKNDPNEPLEEVMIPIESKRGIVIQAPPIIPHVIDEVMPQELHEVTRSDDPGRAPSVKELKCVEIGIFSKNTFRKGEERKSNEIYRVDLTREEPVIYKRMPIPKSEQGRTDAMGSDENAEWFTAIADFLNPLPQFRYVKIDTTELKTIVEIIKDCRKRGPYHNPKL